MCRLIFMLHTEESYESILISYTRRLENFVSYSDIEKSTNDIKFVRTQITLLSHFEMIACDF